MTTIIYTYLYYINIAYIIMYTLLYKSLINVVSSSNSSTAYFNEFYIKHELKPISQAFHRSKNSRRA